MDLNYIQQIILKATAAGVNIHDAEAFKLFMKDTLDLPRPDTGWMYQNGPFSMISDDPISSVINGGSQLLNWLPSRLVDYRFEDVQHLEWIAPEGFDGSDTYAAFLAAQTVDDCDFGPSAVWSGFEYQQEGGRWSFTSPVLKEEDFGMKDFERQPVYQLRGSNIGSPLADEREWAVARTLFMMEQHFNYLIAYGNRDNSVFEYDGIDKVITPGYVQAKKVGHGTPHWADPLVVNAANTTDPIEVLKLIRAVVRKLRNRALSRNWSINPADMVIIMPAGMWPYIADAHASGGNVGFVNTNFNGQMTYSDFLRERARITQAGIGSGFIEVDGTAVPVIIDGNMGQNRILDPDGTPKQVVTGDIFILTRRANGLTLLEQQYVNYNAMQTPSNGEQEVFTMFGGLVKGGWKMINNSCFQYYLKAGGRLVTYFQPLQARINNVAMETILENENEGGAFWSPDFYAYNGAQGGNGNVLLTPA